MTVSPYTHAKQAIQGGDNLAFPTVKIQWINGNSKLSKLGGVQHLGGFAIPTQDAKNMPYLDLFSHLETDEITNKKGIEWGALVTRNLQVAVVTALKSWSEFKGDIKSTVDVLLLIGDGEGNVIMPALFTTNVFTGQAVLEAIKLATGAVGDWTNKNTEFGALPLSTCWVSLGTFGAYFEDEVGSEKTSPITPCLFDADTEPVLVSVGTMELINELQEKAAPWFEQRKDSNVSDVEMTEVQFNSQAGELLSQDKVNQFDINAAMGQANGREFQPAWDALIAPKAEAVPA